VDSILQISPITFCIHLSSLHMRRC
jgi:hypothetical protein